MSAPPAAVGKPQLVPGGQFHSVPANGVGKAWAADLASLRSILDTGVKAGKGVDETTLLNWFGESVERMALLAYATHGVVPNFVAREMTLGLFRADFSWVLHAGDESGWSTACFVELEGALHDTLFQQRGRAAPYIGSKFLDGFSQLVDWCSFGQHQAETHPGVAAALKGAKGDVHYEFCLVAGMKEFANDLALKNRLKFWHQNITLGRGTRTFTYSDLCWLIPHQLNNQGRA